MEQPWDVADAIRPDWLDEPTPVPKPDIPDDVHAVSSASGSMFDTEITVEALRSPADGDIDELLRTLDDNEADEPEPMVGEDPPAGNQPDYALLPIRSGFWKESAFSNYDQAERSNVEAYLRKLRTATESESAENRRTGPIDAYNPVPKERSIIESIFSWSEKESSEGIVGLTVVVLVVGAMLLQATGTVDFPLVNLIIVVVLIGSFALDMLKNLDS